MIELRKYPRTPHLEGSRLQPGDHDLSAVSFWEIQGRTIVCEEKVDGANAGVCFGAQGQLLLQSRGHFLMGGERERQFNLFKQWGHTHADALRNALGSRYVMYGEWLFAKHTIFYDQLPHYFVEFDVLDRETGTFLGTDHRRELLRAIPVVSAPVLHVGKVRSMKQLLAFIGPSQYRSSHARERLVEWASERGLDPLAIERETDRTDLMEGLYIKVEEDGQVVERFKYVRASFLTGILDSGSHWMHRPLLPNLLREGVDLFGGTQ